MSDEHTEKIKEFKAQAQKLIESIEAAKKEKVNGRLNDVAATAAPNPKIRTQRYLKGHLEKVYALDWAKDSHNFVSAATDGKMITWDAVTTNKQNAFGLKCSWVMATAYSPKGGFVASGGLDNLVSVYTLGSGEVSNKPTRELSGHTGYISGIIFLTEGEVLSSSGDHKVTLWNVEDSVGVNDFGGVDASCGHTSDVSSISLMTDKTFISGSMDKTCKLWDARKNECVATYRGHKADVNEVQCMSDGHTFVAGCEDATLVLWDTRADNVLQTYKVNQPDDIGGCNSLALSKSGSYLFAAYEVSKFIIWDTLTSSLLSNVEAHNDRVSCLGISHDGLALATGSWDNTLKIWA